MQRILFCSYFFFLCVFSGFGQDVEAGGKTYRLVNDSLLYEVLPNSNLQMRLKLPFTAFQAHWAGRDQLISDGTNMYVLEEKGIAEGFYLHKIDPAFNLQRLDDSYCYGYLCREGRVIRIRDKVYYLGHTDKHGYEMYRLDSGLKLDADLNKGAGNAFYDDYHRSKNFPLTKDPDQQNLVIYAYSDVYGHELFWYTDQNEVLVYDHSSGLASSQIGKLEVQDKNVHVIYTSDESNDSLILAEADFSPMEDISHSDRWIRWISGDNVLTDFVGATKTIGTAAFPDLQVIAGMAGQSERVQYYASGEADALPNTYYTYFIAAYNSDGSLAWHYPYRCRGSLQRTVTKYGDDQIITLLPHQDSSIFADRELKVPGFGLRVIRLGKSGEILQDKLLKTHRGFDVNTLKATDATILVALQYFGGSLTVEGLEVSSEAKQEEAVLRLNENLDPLYLENVEPVDSVSSSEVLAMEIDEENNRAYVVRSRGHRRWWSSCNYSKWWFNVTAHDLEDFNTLWKTTAVGSDLNFAQDVVITNNDFIVVAGQYRDELSFGGQDFERSHCNSNGFYAYLDKYTGEVRRGFSMPRDDYELYDVDYLKNTIVTMGRVNPDSFSFYKEQDLLLSIFDLNGNLLAEQSWKHGKSDFEHYEVDLQGESLYLYGNVEWDFITGYPRTGEQKRSFFLLKEPVPDGLATWIEEQEAEGTLGISLFPNPVMNGEFQLFREGNVEWPSENVVIYNILGQRVASYNIGPESVMKFVSLSPQATGQYILKFEGSNVAIKFLVR